MISGFPSNPYDSVTWWQARGVVALWPPLPSGVLSETFKVEELWKAWAGS